MMIEKLAELLKNPIVLRALMSLVAAIIYALTQGKLDLTDTLTNPDFWLGLGLGGVAIRQPFQKPKVVTAVRTLMGLALALSLTGCTPQKRVDWPKVLECGPDISDIITTVTRILLADGPRSLSPSSTDELRDLALVHGTDVVACTIERLIQDWTRPGSAQAPETLMAASRGRQFLETQGVVEVRLP